VSWSAISQHLTVLKAAGFVVERRAGRSRLYRADKAALGRRDGVVAARRRATRTPP
jgi:DNA-binding transcriptional ArsR family regulator